MIRLADNDRLQDAQSDVFGELGDLRVWKLGPRIAGVLHETVQRDLERHTFATKGLDRQ